MTGLLDRIASVQRITGDDQVRRARLIMLATGATVLYLLASAAVSLHDGEPVVAAVSLAVALPALVACLLGRSGQIHAAEWATACLVACGALAVVAIQGPISARLTVLHTGVVLLGLAVRPWMTALQVIFGVVVVWGAVAVSVPLPLAPATTPVWVGLAQQLVFITALMMAFTTGYQRVHATLAQRTAHLEVAHTDLVAARASLERAVDDRTAELERANADLEAFATTVAHDLHAPLRRIRQFLELAIEDAVELDDDRRTALQSVQAQAGELSALVEAILADHRRTAHPPR
ncbi:MAG TPA: histidine kinase dimerization/phospho-acceptor domain-containing protein [Kofleriaceae bacterium]|jgi:signal transduction histidine kinase|nr:histidine kinase dimerization/phospho-acceptor domain-containing protein [Kofleriaceae bacterium]